MSTSNSLSARIPAYPSRARSLSNLSKHAGAHKTLISLTLPLQPSPDCVHTLVHQAHAHLAINNTSAALSILSTDSEYVTVRAVSALARYTAATTRSSSDSFEGVEATWEEFRDASDGGKWLVRPLAGTGFARLRRPWRCWDWGETRGASRRVYSFLPHSPGLILIKCKVVLTVRLFLYQQADLTKKGCEGTKQTMGR